MDYYMRCNTLACRVQLKERAVVTTCSHIFCLVCADQLGLSRHPSSDRQCPACQRVLVNTDDVASTNLSPTKDYKASILSGLDPKTTMECAGRALMFWSYQVTQEVFYQEFLAKNLTEKYTQPHSQMDKVVQNANAEIKSLQTRISDMQKTQAQLEEKNDELYQMYCEKSKKYDQITNLYNLLKSRTMRSQMQTAGSKPTPQVLDSVAHPPSTPGSITQIPETPSRGLAVTNEGIGRLHLYQRSGIGSSSGRKAMPPPKRPIRITKPMATPQRRTRFPGPSHPPSRLANLPHDKEMFQRFHAPSDSSQVSGVPCFTGSRNIFPGTNTPSQSPRIGLKFGSYLSNPRR